MSELEPGRELDALMAEHVMEWVHIRTSQQGYGECWELPDGTRLNTGSEVPGLIGWSPSTDIAASFEALGRFSPRNFYVQVSFDQSCTGKWLVVIVSHVEDTPYADAIADTAPHAICLAALKAVGYKA